MTNIKFSIIIPAYNTKDFILRTLRSIEDQTYKNYEIIIINDGSTDGTRELVDSYKVGKDNIIVHHQDNQGVSIARNVGIHLATGDFICFIDSDDTYNPMFLEEMLLKQEATGFDVIYCGFNWINEEGKTIESPRELKSGSAMKRYYTDLGFVHFGGMIIKRNLLISSGINFEPHRKISEDVLFTVKLFNQGPIGVVEKYLYNYFYRDQSAINSKWDDNTWLSDLGGNRKALDYINKYYNKIDKDDVVKLASLRLLKREIDFLSNKMIELKFKKINDYLKSSNFIDTYINNKSLLSKSEIRKASYITGGRLSLFFGFLYYKYFRFNLKK